MVPQPVLAVVMLFPIKESSERHRAEEQGRLQGAVQARDSKPYFMSVTAVRWRCCVGPPPHYAHLCTLSACRGDLYLLHRISSILRSRGCITLPIPVASSQHRPRTAVSHQRSVLVSRCPLNGVVLTGSKPWATRVVPWVCCMPPSTHRCPKASHLVGCSGAGSLRKTHCRL